MLNTELCGDEGDDIHSLTLSLIDDIRRAQAVEEFEGYARGRLTLDSGPELGFNQRGAADRRRLLGGGRDGFEERRDGARKRPVEKQGNQRRH
jgi:hypothetical protein